MPGQIQGSRAGPGPAWGRLGGGGGLAVPIQEAVGQRPQQIRGRGARIVRVHETHAQRRGLPESC